MTFRPIAPVHAFVLALAVSALSPLAARAELHIDITRGKVEPMPIAIPDFAGGSQVGQQIAPGAVRRSRALGPVPADRSEGLRRQGRGDARAAALRRLARHQRAGARHRHVPRSRRDGRLQVEFRLWDVFAEQQLTGLRYTTTQQNWRRIAHIIADAIYKRITGEDGYFDTRIVYIAESGPLNRRIKRLAIMDQDGANNHYLTDGRALVLTPRFSPTAQEITYLSYRRQPRRGSISSTSTPGSRRCWATFPA